MNTTKDPVKIEIKSVPDNKIVKTLTPCRSDERHVRLPRGLNIRGLNNNKPSRA